MGVRKASHVLPVRWFLVGSLPNRSTLSLTSALSFYLATRQKRIHQHLLTHHLLSLKWSANISELGGKKRLLNFTHRLTTNFSHRPVTPASSFVKSFQRTVPGSRGPELVCIGQSHPSNSLSQVGEGGWMPATRVLILSKRVLNFMGSFVWKGVVMLQWVLL